MKTIMITSIRVMILSIISLIINDPLFAQLQYMPAAVHPFSLSLGGGLTNMYANTSKKILDGAARGNFDYNITPFISLGIEGQYGKMADGKMNDFSSGGPIYSESLFYAANLNFRIGLGQWLQIKNNLTEVLGGIYVGAGIGYLNTDVQKIQYELPANTTENDVIEYKHQLVVVPVNVGLNKDLPVYKMGINLNFQYDVTQSNALDGFNYKVAAHSNKDGYSFLSLALRYYFGRVK